MRILLVGADATLRADLDDALAGLVEVSAVVYTADGPAAGETARTRRPDLILFELTEDLKAARHLVEDLRAAAPRAAVAAAFRPDLFGPDLSEAAFFIEAIRAGVQDFLRRPLSSADLGQLLHRLDRPVAASGPVADGKVISFVSNKGGVGKSTLAVSTACLLAVRHPGRVLLVDASLQMGVCATLLNLRPPTTLHDAVREWDRLDESLVRRLAARHLCGLHLLAAPADAEEAAAVDDRVISRVVALARRSFDFVVVDTFPLLDRVVLAALDLSDRINIVLENVVPTILGAVQLVKLFDRFGVRADRQRVVVNRYDSGSGGPSPADVAARLGRAVDHVVPYTKKIVTAANLGEPYALHASTWWGFGKAVKRLVDDLVELAPARTPARDTAPPERNPE